MQLLGNLHDIFDYVIPFHFKLIRNILFMGTPTSYQLQKIDGETILDRIWVYETKGNKIHTQQVKLCSLELMKLRQYLQDKKLNCITCNKQNLSFQEAYVKCFRDKNHMIELIISDHHLFCILFGKIPQGTNYYKDNYLCIHCNKCFPQSDVKCICCHRKLRVDTREKNKFKRKLLRN